MQHWRMIMPRGVPREKSLTELPYWTAINKIREMRACTKEEAQTYLKQLKAGVDDSVSGPTEHVNINMNASQIVSLVTAKRADLMKQRESIDAELRQLESLSNGSSE